MTESVSLRGQVVLTTFDAAGTQKGTWRSTNTICNAGLNDLVGAIAYAGVQDIASNIGAVASPITPIYGAVGAPTTATSIMCNVTPTGIAQGTVNFFSSLTTTSVASGTGVPAGATVTSIASDKSSITLSAAATATSSTTPVTFTSGGASVTLNVVLTTGSTTVTPALVGAFSGVVVNSTITGPGVPVGTYVTAVATDGSSVTASATITTSTSAVLSFTLPAPIAVQSSVTSGSSTLIPVSGTYGNIGLGWVVVDQNSGLDIPSGTTVTAISPTLTSITLSAPATGTNASESVLFAPALTDVSDTQLFNELPGGSGRTTAAAIASSPYTSIANAAFTWQFQFPVNYGSEIDVTEVGVFLVADAGAGDGNLLNHAFINPPAVWGNGQMLMLTVSIGMTN